MTIYPLLSVRFSKYGQILAGYDFIELLSVLIKDTPIPTAGFIYVASDPLLESLPIFAALEKRGYGGMPIQLGYCNGVNPWLNCLEYHRDSEICIMANDTILLLGCQSEIEGHMYDTSQVEAFLVPAGTGVELFATTLHYAPCSSKPGAEFRVATCLPRGTNGKRPAGVGYTGEDRLLLACNKWVLAHAESAEAAQGAHIGLTGLNINVVDNAN